MVGRKTESEIKDLVKKALSEADVNAKKRYGQNAINTFRAGKGGYNAIRTFGVVTAGYPDCQKVSEGKGKKLMRFFPDSLKSAHFPFVEQVGHFGENIETSYFIFNISLETLTYYAGLYERASFCYCYFDEGKVISQYWQKQRGNEPYSKNKNPYILLEDTDSPIDANDKGDCQVIGNQFQYTLPLKRFEDVNRIIISNADTFINESFAAVMCLANDCTGETAWRYRNKLYKGLF